MPFEYYDALAGRAVRALKSDPRYHATVKATAAAYPDNPLQIMSFQQPYERALQGMPEEGFLLGWHDPTDDTVHFEKTPYGTGPVLAHEMTHALYEAALRRGDRKSMALDLETGPSNYVGTAQELVARLGQAPTVNPSAANPPTVVKHAYHVLRNLRSGELNPVRDPRQIERMNATPLPESDWPEEYLGGGTTGRPDYPYSLNLAPLNQQPTDWRSVLFGRAGGASGSGNPQSQPKKQGGQ